MPDRDTYQRGFDVAALSAHCVVSACARRRRAWSLALVLAISAIGASSDVVVDLPERDVLRFIVVADAGTGSGRLHDALLSVASRERIDAVLVAGDNVYPCGVAAPDDPGWSKVTANFGDLHVPVYPVLGNHDYGDPTDVRGTVKLCGDPSPQAQIDASGTITNWTFPDRQYRLTSSLVDIVMFDSQPIASDFRKPFKGSLTAAQEVAWIRSAMTASNAPWRIAVGHHTIYSSGTHGIENGRNQRRMRAAMLPMLSEFAFDLYVCGHDHDLELIGAERQRPVFLIAGGGAHSLPLASRRGRSEPATIFPASASATPFVGFAVVEVTATTMCIQFFDSQGGARGSGFFLTVKRRAP